MYQCERCGKEFNRKNNYFRHLKRKYPCKPLKKNISLNEILNNFNNKESCKEYVCEFCNKKYSRKNNLTYHQKHSCKKKTEIDKDKNYWKTLFQKSEEQKQELIKQEKKEKAELIKLFRKEKEDFMNQIELLLTKVGNNNITNIQQNNIIIRNFGEENVSYLTNSYFKRLFSDQQPVNTIPSIVKKIYFNFEHPENMNLKIENTDQPHIKVFKGDKWHLEDKKDTIHKIVNDKFNLINNKFTQVKQELPIKKINDYKEYKKNILKTNSEKSKEYINHIVKNTENIILISS